MNEIEIRKWLMKQQWRVVQIRGIWGLFYAILLLAVSFYDYIPFFVGLGSFGPFAFAGTVLVGFLILGYIYDRVLVMWAPSQEITMERNPYQYVPAPKDKIFWFPIYSTFLDAAEKISRELKLDDNTIQETKEYYSKIQQLKPERKGDLDRGIELRKEFWENHRFSDLAEKR